jgi:hypothetical protein
MNKTLKLAREVTPERFCEIANDLIDFVDEYGNPTKMTPEIAAWVLSHPDFLSQLPPLPPGTIFGGSDS